MVRNDTGPMVRAPVPSFLFRVAIVSPDGCRCPPARRADLYRANFLPEKSADFVYGRGQRTGIAYHFVAGWSSPVAREAHNLEVVGSNPAAPIQKPPALGRFFNRGANAQRLGPRRGPAGFRAGAQRPAKRDRRLQSGVCGEFGVLAKLRPHSCSR